MIASSNGCQYLVGVAGGSTSYFSNQQQRMNLIGEFDWKNRWQEAWRVPRVQECYDFNRATFITDWKQDLHWTPVWICPEDLFLWLANPHFGMPGITLNPAQITGKNRLVTMYSSYQQISRRAAMHIFDSIQNTNGLTRLQLEILDSIRSNCNIESDRETDINIIKNQTKINGNTTRQSLIDARIGQGRFRASLLNLWRNSCAVTGCNIVEALRASHVKPWRISSDKERLDQDNGLLLVANLDALFDVGFISFENNGTMLVSTKLNANQRRILGIPSSLIMQPNANLSRYLSFHRKEVFVP